jgi:hypothetical protein
MLSACVDAFSKTKGGIQVLAGLAPSSPTVESLLRIGLLVKQERKMIVIYYFFNLANMYFSSENSTTIAVTVSKFLNP